MNTYELISPCHFGMESVLKREISDLGYDIVSVEDGKVTYRGDLAAICRANIFLRTTERVLLKVGQFRAETFEDLFQGTKAIPWERYLPEHAKFWVAKANSIKSRLFSPSDIQSIMKKAMVERMKSVYHRDRFPEDGPAYALRVTIIKDVVTVGIDTSGESLHKRGYRKFTSKAPVTETLAAAILLLSPWKSDRILIDPFCGSGTFPIEAAMIGTHIAPGAKRSFAAEEWPLIPAECWKAAREEAEGGVLPDVHMQIQGYDLDPAMIEGARENARNAGVEGMIHLQVRDVRDLHSTKKYGFVITNPPYGERLEEKESMPALYQDMAKAFRQLDTWSFFILTGYEDAQKYLGRKADKNRKIYNGMLKTYLYQYMGPRPPKRTEGSL